LQVVQGINWQLNYIILIAKHLGVQDYIIMYRSSSILRIPGFPGAVKMHLW